MSVIEDMPLSIGSEPSGSENGGSSEHQAARSNRSFALPPLNQDRTKFSSHSMGELPPLELDRADFVAFSQGDLPPIDIGFDADDLATQSLPVDLMSMKGLKGFKKPGLQLRRSQFSQKDLVLDGVERCTASPSTAIDLLFSTLPDPESSRHR